MIARIWTGATQPADADAYEQYMREVALPGYANVTGNRAVLMLRRARGNDHTEFTMVTIWDSLESITAFAGPDPEQAVFYPRDDQFLTERDLTVRHYKVYGSHGLAELPPSAQPTAKPELTFCTDRECELTIDRWLLFGS